MQKIENFDKDYDHVFNAVRSLPKIDAPDGFKDEILQKIENTPSNERGVIRKTSFPEILYKKRFAIGVPAACIAAFFILVYSGAITKNSSYNDEGYSYAGGASTSSLSAESPTAAPAPQATAFSEIAFDSVGSPNENTAMADIDYQASAESASVAEEGETMRQSSVNYSSERASQKVSKIIKTSNYSIDVTDFDKLVSDLRKITESAGGYVESFNIYIYNSIADANGNRNLKSGNITLRIPQDTYQSAKIGIENLGTITGTSESIDDVTANYVDISARLDVKKAEEQRLLELFAKAEKIEDLISLETRLTYVRSDIESMVAQLNNWDRSVSFSTINISATEVVDYSKIQPLDPSLGEKIMLGFNLSFSNFTFTLERIIISAAENSIAIIIFVLMLMIIHASVKIYKNKRSL